MEIKPLGGFYPLSTEGYILNVGHVDNIKNPWLELTEAIKQLYLKKCGSDLHSIYIRGSVARGQAIARVSDVDSFAVLKPDVSGPDNSWHNEAEQALLQRYPFAAEIEFDIIPYRQSLQRSYPTCMTIKTQSACIYGPDLAEQIAPFKPNAELISHLYYLHHNIRTFKTETETETDPTELKLWHTWLMKQFLRCGFELVMEREGQYTRDLYPSYAAFSKYYPQYERAMYQALSWAISPIDNRLRIIAYIEDFGQWLCQQAESRYPNKIIP